MRRFTKSLRPLLSHHCRRPVLFKFNQSYFESQSERKFKSLRFLGLILAGGGSIAVCEDKQTKNEDPDYNFLNIKMPAILREKQAERERAYQRVKQQAMSELEELGDSTFREQIREYTKGVTEEEQAAGFAAMVEDAKMLSEQNIRQVYLGPHQSLLKPGRLIQLSIAKFNSPNEYDPLDRVIVMRNGDIYHALSSFCGYDMTDLANGVALGNKLICPTCGSEYRIYDGKVNFGPSFQGLVSFEVVNRKGHLFLLVPKQGIPPFSRNQIQNIKRLEKLDTRTVAIVGSSEAIFGLIQALRKVYMGKIVLVPLKKSGLLENKTTLCQRMEPLEKDDVMIVDQDFFNRMNVTVKTEPRLLGVDLVDKYLHFEGDEFVDFDKIVYAVECEDRAIPNNIKNPKIIPLTSFQNHARIHNQAIDADDIVIYGSTIEAFQAASSLRSYLDTLNRQHVKITIIDDQMSEVLKNFGPQVYIKIVELLGAQNINVLTGITLKGVVDTGNKLKIHFKYRPYSKVTNKLYEGNNSQIYSCYLKADLVIKKTQLGEPIINFHTLSHDKDGHIESELNKTLRVNSNFQASSNTDHDHFIYGTGPSVSVPSIFSNDKMHRNANAAYNIQQGYVAGLNVVDKKFHLDFPPITHFQIASQHFFFLGQRGHQFTNVVPDSAMQGDNKFVMYYQNKGRVIGALIMGYKNLHIYLSQAIQIGVFPSQEEMLQMKVNSKQIVERVLKNQDKIRCINEKELQYKISHKFYEKDDEIEEYKEQSEKQRTALQQEQTRRQQIVREQEKKDEETRKRKDGQVEMVRDESDIGVEQVQQSRETILNSYMNGLLGKSKKA